MNSYQFQAGYTIDCLCGPHGDHAGRLNPLLKSLACFEVETKIKLNKELAKPNPHFAVLNNILCRGLPTRMSLELERKFAHTFQHAKETTFRGSICFKIDKQTDLSEPFFRALHIIDPRVSVQEKSYRESLSSFESNFLFNEVGRKFPFLLQLLEPQRELDSIIRHPFNFHRQRADFTLELPYSDSINGHLFEIDGPHHTSKVTQQILDENRDVAVNNSGWQVHRIGHISESAGVIGKLLAEEYVKVVQENYQDKVFDRAKLNGLQLALSPFAIARLQKVLLELLLKGVLKLEAEVWKIVVFERDVPCAHWAIADLQEQLRTLFQLSGTEIQLPEVELLIITTPEFRRCAINRGTDTFLVDKVPADYQCDVLIDIAMLTRSGVQKHKLPDIRYSHALTIRSAHHAHTKRQFYTSDLINFGDLIESASKQKALKYFLRTIFRKNEFRDGQIEILSRALQVQSVIGLLPTGGGKSLTYQLAVMLQPGVALIVDPLKSLMKDQVDNLIKNKIDACIFINSSIKTFQERNRAMAQMVNGESLFTFISPERFQIQAFRDALATMHDAKVFFSYCIIDEAHCVSEWGHDFRTSYLRLGENALEHCKTKNRKYIPLFGLTATASFDVLADVQRELSTPSHRLGEDAIVRSENVGRPELKFHVANAPAEFKGKENEWDIKTKVSNAKKQVLDTILETLDDQGHITRDLKSGGLIFCPHTQGLFGVTDRFKKDELNQPVAERKGVADTLVELPNLKVGIYRSANEDDSDLQVEMEKEMIENQTSFIENRLNLLVATKAFGMGIDKPNVRYTIHFNYPGSLESYVQEAGRAGRDGADAHCYILFNDQEVEYKNKIHEVDKDHLLYFHNLSFKGADSEKELLSCFLKSISRGTKTIELTNLIAEKLEIEAKVNMWQSKGGAWYLTISRAFREDYLRIGLSNLAVYKDNSVDLDTALLIESLALEFLDTKPTSSDVVSWLSKETIDKGVSQSLDEINVDEEAELTVGFRSKWKKGDGEIIADKQDTEKAIYRLSTIGVVDDYTVDYNAKTITLSCKKKTREAYIGHLKNYIRQYYSETRTKLEIQNFEKTLVAGSSLIHSLLNYLVDFVYREIEKKRRLGIDVMKEACYKGLEEDGSRKFSEFLDMYFNSKYARSGYTVAGANKSLADRTKNGVEQNIKWVWEFMEVVNVDKSGGQIDNLKHLRGACTRLLVTAPDNLTLRLLRAFALFILEVDNPNPKMMEEAADDLERGFETLSTLFDEVVWLKCLKQYKTMLSQSTTNPKLGAIIDNLFDSIGRRSLYESYLDLTATLETTNHLLSQYGYHH